MVEGQLPAHAGRKEGCVNREKGVHCILKHDKTDAQLTTRERERITELQAFM